MEYKSDKQSFEDVLKEEHIKYLYHFTDFDNIASIIKNGGLYSWADCEEKGIKIAKPGGGDLSRQLDSRDNLQHYVRVSFTPDHPMMYIAMQDGRISNPVVLDIDPDVVAWQDSKIADMNATKNGRHIGSDLEDLKRVHFHSILGQRYFDLDEDEKPYYQAEVLVKNFIPLEYIKNIGNFGIPIPEKPKMLQSKTPYTAQITRATPTAFIFLFDQSVSMRRNTRLNGENMTMAEAVARIVNNQINELVLRCIKTNEIRHYYDIAVIGYGEDAYSGWEGDLAGRYFVSPEELNDHPFKKITVKEEKRTRRGMKIKEVEKRQWLEPRCDGSWTRMHKAFGKAKELLEEWMKEHHDKDCYPPTIINITDGQFNGISTDEMIQLSNELKSMFTNDGNVLLYNIHIVPNDEEQVLCPISMDEISGNSYGQTLYKMSSLLPSRYNQPLADIRGDNTLNVRHVAMAMNTDMSTLIQLLDIGTPTNISQNQ